MTTSIWHQNKAYSIDLSAPLDISIPLRSGLSNVSAWYLEPPRIEPHLIGGQPGLVSAGAAVNFNDIWFNPHAHGTHTECVGHISPEVYSINKQLSRFFFKAVLISLFPEVRGTDRIITAAQLKGVLHSESCEAVVLRTLPNKTDKLSRKYSHTNPPYIQEEAVKYLVSLGVEHLLVDLPSVDREDDGGALLAHKAFWNYPGPLRMQATITEFIFVPEQVHDGSYFLNLQLAPFENDASPSRPVLYKIESA